MGWLDRLLDRRAERAAHNDLDYECRYWWGDRAGSMQARCRVCRSTGEGPEGCSIQHTHNENCQETT